MTFETRRKIREIDLLAVAAVVAVGILGLLVRRTLSPDGVSYLDLAGALRRGDWSHFVQGYWSPLYPALLALLATIAGHTANQMVADGHLINVLAVWATIAVIWRWARTMTTPWFGRAAIAALIVCSAEPPRVEAFTPDLLLLLIAVCLGYELVVHRGQRWIQVGVLLGLAYLTKTSTWPWLLLVMAARMIFVPDRAARMSSGKANVLALLISLPWVVPMSVAHHWPTFGSTGRLNYHWYLEQSDARTPDTHQGEHLQYQDVPIADSVNIRVASFDTTARSTYQPWSDPDGWSLGMRTHRASTPTLEGMRRYWLDTAWQAISLWLRVLILAVLVPAFWIARRRGQWRELLTRPPTTLTVVAFGVAGVVQYIAVHAEPRLVAPFVLLAALAILHWLFADRDEGTIPATGDRIVLSLVGLAAALFLTVRRIDHARDDDGRIGAGVARLMEVNAAAFAPQGAAEKGFAGLVSPEAPAHARVAVIGPVLPVLTNIYWTGGRVVAQIPPMSLATLRKLDQGRRIALLHQLFNGRADAIWVTTPDGSYNILPVP